MPEVPTFRCVSTAWIGMNLDLETPFGGTKLALSSESGLTQHNRNEQWCKCTLIGQMHAKHCHAAGFFKSRRNTPFIARIITLWTWKTSKFQLVMQMQPGKCVFTHYMWSFVCYYTAFLNIILVSCVLVFYFLPVFWIILFASVFHPVVYLDVCWLLVIWI